MRMRIGIRVGMEMGIGIGIGIGMEMGMGIRIKTGMGMEKAGEGSRGTDMILGRSSSSALQERLQLCSPGLGEELGIAMLSSHCRSDFGKIQEFQLQQRENAFICFDKVFSVNFTPFGNLFLFRTNPNAKITQFPSNYKFCSLQIPGLSDSDVSEAAV